jgi:hypothetical protein
MTAGIPSSVELNKENGHVAEFEYPINGCNRRELRVQVLFQYGYSNQWVDLPGYAASGTSNGDLSVDGYIDLEDMGILAGTMYLCEGPGFVACADYEPDGCVDLQDLGAFAEILYAAGDKSERRDGVAAEAELIACTGIAQDCIVSADTAWKSALIRLRTTGADPQQLGWSPSERYLDRSLMVVNETAGDGEFGIFVVASGDSGLTNIGQLIASTSADLKGIEVLGVEVASAVSFEKSVGGIAPSAALLADACPNPFNPLTRITFELPFADQVSLSVYDIAGRLVRRLVDNQTLAAGSHVAEWDGRNGDGGRVAGGMYLYRLESPSFNLVKRMTMLK